MYTYIQKHLLISYTFYLLPKFQSLSFNKIVNLFLDLLLLVDISELNLPKTCTIAFPNGKDDLMNFEVTIRPDEGYYA